VVPPPEVRKPNKKILRPMVTCKRSNSTAEDRELDILTKKEAPATKERDVTITEVTIAVATMLEEEEVLKVLTTKTDPEAVTVVEMAKDPEEKAVTVVEMVKDPEEKAVTVEVMAK